MTTGREVRAWIRGQVDRDFESAQEAGIKPKCAGKPEFYVNFKASQRPSAEGAARLCADCPLIQACRDFAHNYPAGIAYGVYGGQVWIDGVIQAE